MKIRISRYDRSHAGGGVSVRHVVLHHDDAVVLLGDVQTQSVVAMLMLERCFIPLYGREEIKVFYNLPLSHRSTLEGWSDLRHSDSVCRYFRVTGLRGIHPTGLRQ